MHWFLFFAYTLTTRAYGKKSLEVQDSIGEGLGLVYGL